MYFLFYQIFGLKSEVLGICKYLHICGTLGEMLLSIFCITPWSQQVPQFPQLVCGCLVVEERHNILYWVKVIKEVRKKKKKKSLLEECRGGRENKEWFSQVLKEAMIMPERSSLLWNWYFIPEKRKLKYQLVLVTVSARPTPLQERDVKA